MDKSAKIYVAGHGGMVGSAICRALKRQGYNNIIGRRSSELDLRRQADVEKFFAAEKPEYVFLAAAIVGGVLANMEHPVEFLHENILIEMNVLKQSFDNNVKKLMFIGAGSIYPRDAVQPQQENSLLTGVLDKSNEVYALAKIAGIKYCEYANKEYNKNFISVMPTNLYGVNDNYNDNNSHVVPSMIRKFHEAKTTNSPYVTLWGTGKPTRDFLYVDDLAEACVFLMETYDGSQGIVNIGSGKEQSIAELAAAVKNAVGYTGEIRYDATKPDGVPRRSLDITKLRSLGWKKEITPLAEGLKITYEDYISKYSG